MMCWFLKKSHLSYNTYNTILCITLQWKKFVHKFVYVRRLHKTSKLYRFYCRVLSTIYFCRNVFISKILVKNMEKWIVRSKKHYYSIVCKTYNVRPRDTQDFLVQDFICNDYLLINGYNVCR